VQFSCFTSFNCTEIVRLSQESITTSSLLTFTFSLSWSQLSVVNVVYVTAGGATFLSIFGFSSAAAAAAACCHRRHNLAYYVIQSFIRRVVAHCHPFLFFFFFSYWIDLRFSSLFFLLETTGFVFAFLSVLNNTMYATKNQIPKELRLLHTFSRPEMCEERRDCTRGRFA